MNALRYQESKQRGSPDFPLACYTVDEEHERYRMPCHWHEESEWLQVTDGVFRLDVEGRAYVLRPGDAAYVAPGRLHGGEPEGCRYRCAVADLRLLLRGGAAVKRLAGEATGGRVEPPVYFPADDPVNRQTITPLFEALERGGTGYELTAAGCLHRFLGMLYETERMTCRSADGRTDRRSARLKKALALIETEYAAPLSLERLASAAGMSPKYFCRVFRDAVHRSPTDYLNWYRIERAREMLAQEESVAVTRAALETGFSDVNYFIRLFRRYVGTTPGRYAQAARMGKEWKND